MSNFGETLKAEREQRGLALDDVARAVDLDRERLLALERNELAAMPDDHAMAEPMRAYAEVLGVDAGLMFDDYRKEREACLARLDAAIDASAVAEAATAAEVSAAVEPPPAAAPAGAALPEVVPWKTYSVLAIGALALVAGFWMYSGGDAPSAGVAESAPAAEPSSVSEAAAPVEPAARPEIAAPREPAVRPEPTAAPVPEPTPSAARAPAPAPVSPGAVAVDASGVGTGVENRQLVGESATFAEGAQVWFWNRVVGGESGDRIEHVWLHEGVERARIALRIGGSRWRTQSAKRMHPGSTGSWKVEARDASGRVLASAAFDCVP